jgi:dolichyl-phosphate beta-glucosyltransferase
MKTLIIPFFQSEKIVKNVVDFLLNHYKDDNDIEFIFVNDGSLDKTYDILLSYSDPRIKIINNTRNMGKGHAIKQGYLQAKGDRVVFTDDDIPYGIEIVDLMFKDLNFVKVVIGKRKFNSGLIRRFVHYISKIIVFFSFGFDQIDTQCGVKGAIKNVCKKYAEKSIINSFGFDVEFLYYCYLNKIPVLERKVCQKNYTESTIKIKDLIFILKDLVKVKKNTKKYIEK